MTHDRDVIRRMLKNGNTLMSYELDYSMTSSSMTSSSSMSHKLIKGRFYDETVNIEGNLNLSSSTGRLLSYSGTDTSWLI